MWGYVGRRLLHAIPVLLILSVVTFALVSAAPGGLTAFMSSQFGPPQSAAQLARYRHIYGLDQPVPVQFLRWLGQVLQGNLGSSYQYGEPVSHVLGRTLPMTLALTTGAMIIALLIAIPVGVVTAYRPKSALDYASTFTAFVGVSVPSFVLALLAIFFFGAVLPILPVQGSSSNPMAPFSLWDFLQHLLLPAVALALPIAGSWVRFVRSSMLDALNEPYIRTARAKGMGERSVLLSHALRNALLPLITLVGATITYMVSISAVVEYVFQWPGLGSAYIGASSSHDLPLIMGSLLVVGVAALAGSLLADLAYAVADPRIRLD
jgi:peptide/nickel transport system permease protein